MEYTTPTKKQKEKIINQYGLKTLDDAVHTIHHKHQTINWMKKDGLKRTGEWVQLHEQINKYMKAEEEFKSKSLWGRIKHAWRANH